MKVEINQCKTCNYHICIMKTKVFCGYNIDREEKSLYNNNNVSFVEKCPKLK